MGGLFKIRQNKKVLSMSWTDLMFNSFAVFESKEVASLWRTVEVAYPPVCPISSQFMIGQQLHSSYEVCIIKRQLRQVPHPSQVPSFQTLFAGQAAGNTRANQLGESLVSRRQFNGCGLLCYLRWLLLDNIVRLGFQNRGFLSVVTQFFCFSFNWRLGSGRPGHHFLLVM